VLAATVHAPYHVTRAYGGKFSQIFEIPDSELSYMANNVIIPSNKFENPFLTYEL